MARIFDVIEYSDEMENELVHRFPETGIGDYRIGSQVIVREAQNAVFFRDGQALDKFGPGRHTIATGNIPKVIDFIGKAFNNRTPFPAEVYFVSMKEFPELKWGTPQPIIVRNPGVGLGVALLQGFGTYSIEVSDPQQFVTQVVGTKASYMMDDIDDRLRTMLLSKLTDLLGETGANNSVLEMIGLAEELGAGVRAKAQPDFAALGLTLKSFYIGNLKPSSKSAQELRDMGMLDMATYTQLQAADAMRDAANNEGGGAGLTAGIGAGMGIGNLMQNATSGSAMAQNQQKAAPAAASGGGGMPSVMTPAEAAAILKVSQEDVMAAIEAGDLKAKKLGSAYRISKGALERFLSE
ncbi:MAG: helix-turn-helix domain-containing protein [Chloroflexi bacterium]|nr:helix-turn-helix domain-containing protein [Chloroflexota bacterium]